MDLISLLTTANEAGLGIGPIIAAIVMTLKIEAGIKKREVARLEAEKLKEAKREQSQNEFANKIVAALHEHDAKYDQRFTTLETHVGLKK